MDLSKLVRCGACAVALLFAVPAIHAADASGLRTPLEKAHYEQLTSPTQVGNFLRALERRDKRARHVVVGRSADGRPLDALLVSQTVAALARGESPSARLRVMILGSQHGNEPSGAEAILMLARDLLDGTESTLLDRMEFVLLPLGNPDGRETGQRANGNGIDLGTDYNVLTEPESRAVVNALVRWRPDVFVDVHESAVFKPKTLARQGYMTDFQAQFEIANNPNVDQAMATLARERIRPQIISRLRGEGLAASDYIREITDIHQWITSGGVTVKNLRNRAGMEGALSLLIEGRLDPPGGTYPTPRNIRQRASKQLMSLKAILAVCLAARDDIAARSRAARAAWRNAERGEHVYLSAEYQSDPGRETIVVPLRRIDNEEIEHRHFPYLARIVPVRELALPVAYAITAHRKEIGAALKRQHIHFETAPASRNCRATTQHIRVREAIPNPRGQGNWRTETVEREGNVTLPAGTIWVSMRQPERRLISLLLEPQSSSSLFEHPDYAGMLAPGTDFFVLRIGACGGAPNPRP